MTMNLTHTAARAPAVPAPGLAFAAEPERAAEGGPHDFAGLLVERRAERAADGARPGQRNAFDVPAAPKPVPVQPPAAAAPAAAPPHDPRPKTGEAPHTETTATAGRSAERTAAARKGERGERPRTADAAPAPRSQAVADAAATDDAAADGATDPLEAIRAQAVIDWFARLEGAAPATPAALPADAAAAATAARAGKDAKASQDVVDLASAAATTDAPGRATPGLAVPTQDAPPSAATALVAPADDHATFAEVAAQALRTEPVAAAREPAAPLPLMAALPTALPAAPGSARAGADASLVLDTPVTAPDFSQAFATQLTTLARDGVQQATLQLNPAELGPIAVKIVLDGAQAQIDFAAEHARTREAIEAGLPALAAALDGAGLTLAGGGVFEQRRGHADDASAGPRGGLGDDADATGEAAAAVAPQRQVVRGLLDAYA